MSEKYDMLDQEYKELVPKLFEMMRTFHQHMNERKIDVPDGFIFFTKAGNSFSYCVNTEKTRKIKDIMESRPVNDVE